MLFFVEKLKCCKVEMFPFCSKECSFQRENKVSTSQQYPTTTLQRSNISTFQLF